MKIYIASSARNLHGVQLLRDALTERGHHILDWTALAPPLPDHLSPEERRLALDSDERGDIFAFCSKACMEAEALIYLGPAGQDAACEVGMAYAAGVPTIGLAAPTEKPGLILNRAVRFWASDVQACLEIIDRIKKEGPPSSGRP
ncbi:translation initiation factor 2 [Deltaproteobacteria bacterium Smac51]|nr:translation initiation factor 2 [Deltaproteobacteria bacterium Smac51]